MRPRIEAPEARRYPVACREHGLALRLRADQFSELGTVPLAVELGARSVDPLENTGEEGVRALARSGVAAVLLLACGLFLDLPRPPARRLLDAGAIVVLATDFNPGSSFCESLPVVMNLARTRLGLSPVEAVAAEALAAAPPTLPTCSASRMQGGSRRATRPMCSSSTPPTGGTSPTTSAATASQRW